MTCSHARFDESDLTLFCIKHKQECQGHKAKRSGYEPCADYEELHD